MTAQTKALIRSFLTTFLTVFIGLIPVASLVDGDWTWVGAAAAAAVLAGVRSLVAFLDPGMPLFGNGSQVQ